MDQPGRHVAELFDTLVYGDQPLGWDIAGTKESVSGISREDLLSYISSQYTARNTVVCVAGNLVNRDEIVNKVKKKFAAIKTSESIQKPKVLEGQIKPDLLLHKRQTDQTHFCLGVRGYNLFHEMRYAQDVLGLILGGMMSSRLFVEIREKLGLAYYISADVSSDPDSGYLVTQAGVDNTRVDKAIAAILKEYKKISQIKIPEKELKKAKDHIGGKMALHLESSDAQASFFGFQEILENKILTPEEFYDRINKVRASDVQKVAQDIFQPAKLNLALIGPFEEEKRFQNLLKL